MVEFPLMGKETKSQPKVDILSKSKGKKKKKVKEAESQKWGIQSYVRNGYNQPRIKGKKITLRTWFKLTDKSERQAERD